LIALAAAAGVLACSGSGTDATAGPSPVVAPVDPEGGSPPVAVAAPDADAPSETPAPGTTPAAPSATRAEHLELAFVGDVIFGRYRGSGYDPIPEKGHDPFEAIRDTLRADVLVGNLETPVVRNLPQDSPIGSRFRFGASKEHAALLVEAGFTAVSLANNHSFDQREAGLRETPEILEELGIVPLGRARDDDPLFRVESVEKNGWRIGFLAATTRRNAPQREGMPELPYLETRAMADTLGPILKAARADHDVLAVIVHWGDEYADAPAHVQKTAARALVDAGADLVIGHHPHVLQGIERHGAGIIAYSLGNFVFENTNDPPRLTGVLRVRMQSAERCIERVVFHPAYIKRNPIQHPVPATGLMHGKVTGRVTALGKALGTEWDAEGDDLVLRGPPCSRGTEPSAPPPDPAAP
jgi:poly-gamma-glutamate capsule biosynthesis protein CapA/YwtB (metallophosphatase superfamily)